MKELKCFECGKVKNLHFINNCICNKCWNEMKMPVKKRFGLIFILLSFFAFFVFYPEYAFSFIFGFILSLGLFLVFLK